MAKAIADPGKLTGPEKAAVILLALGEEHAEVWQQLDEEEIKEVSQAMSTLGTVSAQVVEDLMVEFVSGMAGGGAIMGSFEQTQKLLAAMMPEWALQNIAQPQRKPASGEKVSRMNT